MTNSRIPTEVPTSRQDPYRLVGTTLAEKYRLDEYAGGGGMGAVYRSRGKKTGPTPNLTLVVL